MRCDLLSPLPMCVAPMGHRLGLFWPKELIDEVTVMSADTILVVSLVRALGSIPRLQPPGGHFSVGAGEEIQSGSPSLLRWTLFRSRIPLVKRS